MTLTELARHLRPYIEKASASLEDHDALDAVALFPAWRADAIYDVGDRVRHSGILYRCLTAHTAQEGWTPEAAPSLWAQVLIPDPAVIPDWQQPDSTNPYHVGDRVRHNGAIWQSDIEGNVWTPGEYGWTEIGG